MEYIMITSVRSTAPTVRSRHHNSRHSLLDPVVLFLLRKCVDIPPSHNLTLRRIHTVGIRAADCVAEAGNGVVIESSDPRALAANWRFNMEIERRARSNDISCRAVKLFEGQQANIISSELCPYIQTGPPTRFKASTIDSMLKLYEWNCSLGKELTYGLVRYIGIMPVVLLYCPVVHIVVLLSPRN